MAALRRIPLQPFVHREAGVVAAGHAAIMGQKERRVQHGAGPSHAECPMLTHGGTFTKGTHSLAVHPH